jgi:hypothetical protein
MSTNKILTYLDSADARRERATPGPWGIGWVSEVDDRAELVSQAKDNRIGEIYVRAIGEIELRADQTFIAAARTEHAQLCRALRVAVGAFKDCREYDDDYIDDVARNALDRIEAILSEGEA